MIFYIHHRDLYTKKFKERMGALIQVSLMKDTPPVDGEKWKTVKVVGPVQNHDRLVRMLAVGGIPPDGIYPLDGNRTVQSILDYIKTWRA